MAGRDGVKPPSQVLATCIITLYDLPEMEHTAGFEPARSTWKDDMLPLNIMCAKIIVSWLTYEKVFCP